MADTRPRRQLRHLAKTANSPSAAAQRSIASPEFPLNALLSRTAVSVVCGLFVIGSLTGVPADAGTQHRVHHRHHRHSAQHRRHMHHLLLRRLHRSLPAGVGFHRFYDRRTRSVIHVAVIHPGARVRLRPVPASTTLHQGRLVRTSSMCRRVHCLIAVNGSFRDLPSRLPKGAEVINGVPLRLRANEPRQAVFSQRRPVALGTLHTEIVLHQQGAGTVHIHSVNVRPGADGAALFTPLYGPRSPRGFVASVDLPGSARLRLGRSYRVAVHGLRAHATRALRSRHRLTLVSHGQGGWQLRSFLRRVDRSAPITLSTTSPAPTAQSLNTSFRLLHRSHQTVPSLHWHLVRGRDPRTVLATRPDGTVLLITIDGRWRRRSAGASMRQAAYLARRLGATEAVNLDGGGSTTFVVRGHVLNRPSDGFERGVVNGLAVVRSRHPYDPNYLQRRNARR
jgi:hypothetical protein